MNDLEHEHTTAAITDRLNSDDTRHAMLGDFVLGAVDGTITTFAIVTGVAGTGLSVGVAVALGLANVLADGFSMAVGNFLKARSDRQMLERYRRIEEKHVTHVPEGETEEIRQIFAQKGFSGELLEEIVKVITADRQQWVDTMLVEEWGLQLKPPPPIRAAVITFLAFVLAGLVPILPLFLSPWLGSRGTFLASSVVTMLSFALIGAFRGWVTREARWWAALETCVTGGIAAMLAYSVGRLMSVLDVVG